MISHPCYHNDENIVWYNQIVQLNLYTVENGQETQLKPAKFANSFINSSNKNDVQRNHNDIADWLHWMTWTT